MPSLRTPWTVSDEATPEEAQAVASAALKVLWADLAWVDLDLTGLLETPGTADAAGDLLAYRTPKGFGRRGPSDNVRLYPGRHDEALPAAQVLVGHTIGSSGFADGDGLIFDANDAGTSCWFELTGQQASDVRATLSRSGLPPTLLSPTQR